MLRQIFFLFSVTLVLSISLLSNASAVLELGPIASPSDVQPGQSYAVQVNLRNIGNSDTPYTLLEGSKAGARFTSLPVSGNVQAGKGNEHTLFYIIEQNASALSSLEIVLRDDSTSNLVHATLVFNVVNGTKTVQPPVEESSSPQDNRAALSIGILRVPTLFSNGSFNITNTGSKILSAVNISASGEAKILFSGSTSFSLDPGASRIVGATITSAESAPFGESSVTVMAKDLIQQTAQTSKSFSLQKSFCVKGPLGNNLSISNVRIKNDENEDDEWMPFDKVSVKVKIKNIGERDLKDVVVELGLFDKNGRNRVNELDFDNDDEEKIEVDSLGEGEDDEVTFIFGVPGDLDQENYFLTIKAYVRGDEAELCTDRARDLGSETHEEISVEREDDKGKFIALRNIIISPREARCGDSVILSTNVFNVGDDEQDRIRVTLSSPELGINTSQELRRGLDIGEDDPITFNFVIPTQAKNKIYTLSLGAEYDYRNDNYRDMSDTPMNFQFKVFGCLANETESRSIAVKSIKANVAGSESKKEQNIAITAEVDGKAISIPLGATLRDENDFDFNFEGNTLSWALGIIDFILLIMIMIVATKIAVK